MSPAQHRPPAQMSWGRWTALALALGMCGVAQWNIYQLRHWDWASALQVAASLAAAILLGRPQPLERAAVPPPRPLTRLRASLGALLTLAGFAAFACGCATLVSQWGLRFGTGITLVVAGAALWSGGLAVLDAPRREEVSPPMWRWEIALFLAVLALGLFLRFYRYDYFPPPDGFCAVEEPQSGMGANAILHGARPWEFMLDRWLPVPFFLLMGETVTALRLPFTIVSWLTIIPLYLLLRQLVSRPAALFATALFAVCRWHLMYARLAHAVFPTTLIVVLIYYLCVRAYRRGGLALYPLIGLLSAYTLYAYAGYRGTTAFVLLFFAITLYLRLRAWRSAHAAGERAVAGRRLVTQLAGCGLFALTYGSFAAPLYTQLSHHPSYFLEAAERATDDPVYYTKNSRAYLRQRLNRLRETAMMFNHYGDAAWTFNLPGAPQLDPVSGALFVLGLAYCAVWSGRRFQGYFALTFLVLLWFGTVFVHNFDIRRLQGIIPLIFVLIAFAADRFGKVTAARLGRSGPRVVGALGLTAFGLAFWNNYDVYVRRMMNDPAVRAAFQNPYTIGIRYVHELPPDAYVGSPGTELEFAL